MVPQKSLKTKKYFPKFCQMKEDLILYQLTEDENEIQLY